MDAAGWLAHWASVEARYLAERDERYMRIAAKIKAELHPEPKVAPVPVVLVGATEVESDSGLELLPVSAARRVVGAARGAGWSVRVTRALAAVPKAGLVESWAVRCRRGGGDERLWATWWGSSFNAAQYWRVGVNVEILGFRTTGRRRGVVDAIEGRRLQ